MTFRTKSGIYNTLRRSPYTCSQTNNTYLIYLSVSKIDWREEIDTTGRPWVRIELLEDNLHIPSPPKRVDRPCRHKRSHYEDRPTAIKTELTLTQVWRLDSHMRDRVVCYSKYRIYEEPKFKYDKCQIFAREVPYAGFKQVRSVQELKSEKTLLLISVKKCLCTLRGNTFSRVVFCHDRYHSLGGVNSNLIHNLSQGKWWYWQCP
jgi:hypothetical protein